MATKIRELGNLPNKPLAEAIFELRWKTTPLGPGLSHDPGWPNLAFKYFAKIGDKYPEPVELPAAQLPESAAPYAVRNQFRTGPGAWPLTQIGPGILTVNETVGYTVWDDFKPRIKEAIEALASVYPETLTPIRIELRYINAVPYDPVNGTPPAFLREFMHTEVGTASDLFNGEAEGIEPDDLNLNLRFPLSRPAGKGFLNFSSGTKEDNPAIIWQTIVRSAEPDAPKKVEELDSWLEDAHTIVERWFIRLTQGTLIERFEGKETT